MNICEIIFLAIALSIDAFLVSFAYGVVNLKYRNKTSVMVAVGTGLFQALFFLFGAYFTNLIFKFIENYSMYFAGGIFIILGIKLFIDGNSTEEQIKQNELDAVDVGIKTVFIVSVATSIDAFAAGSSLYLLKSNILYSALIIGLITFLNSLIGFYIGEKIKKIAYKNIGKLGGILLILIGLKVIFL